MVVFEHHVKEVANQSCVPIAQIAMENIMHHSAQERGTVVQKIHQAYAQLQYSTTVPELADLRMVPVILHVDLQSGQLKNKTLIDPY